MRKMKMFVSAALVATSAVTLPATTSAQTTPVSGVPATAAPADAKSKTAADSSKLVCRTMDVTGSRLNRKRVCHTAQEWEEQRAFDRMQVERQQANRYKGND